MVQEEFKSNQPFRNPAEYDVFKKCDEVPKATIDRAVADKGKKEDKMVMRGGAAKVPYGEQLLARFKEEDISVMQGENRAKTTNKREIVSFEDELIGKARLYHENIAKRVGLAPGESNETIRQTVASIYKELH